MFERYTEMDRLVIERWPEVMGLIDAQKAAQEHIEAAIESAGERVTRWVREQGFEGEMLPRDAEYHVWRPDWFDRRRAQSRVFLNLGGFCPTGYRKVHVPYPYLWVNTGGLAAFRVKEPERVAFARGLRAALGEEGRAWESDDIDDADEPLGRYLRQYDEQARARLILEPESLVDFCREHLPALFALADPIDAELKRLGV